MYLSGRKQIPVPEVRRPRTPGRELVVRGAKEHNLQDIDVTFPLGMFVAVTGVSGSGKSTLVNDILYTSLAKQIYNARTVPGRHRRIEGLDHVDKVIHVDQSPIGRTPRSNPATYTGVFDHVRKLFASTAGGEGARLPAGPVLVQRQGRPLRGVLRRRHDQDRDELPARTSTSRARSATAPATTARRSRCTTRARPSPRSSTCRSRRPSTSSRRSRRSPGTCSTLVDVGLGYVRLGQPAPTLSGGEAQRVKLAAELQKRSTGRTVYVLDEPTTGLHFEDIRKLLLVLGRLVDQGNTVLVIEHNLDVIKTADWIVDMGPEGGNRGGLVVAEGTPEEVADHPDSYTGQFLKPLLEGSPARQPAKKRAPARPPPSDATRAKAPAKKAAAKKATARRSA